MAKFFGKVRGKAGISVSNDFAGGTVVLEVLVVSEDIYNEFGT